MKSETPAPTDLDALVAALAGREMVVVAPHGTVNTGLVAGDQRQVVCTPTGRDRPAGPLRQGPVRAEYLKAARRCFVPPPSFADGLAILDSGVAVLVGERGTGRESHALNLLAHGSDNPVLVQVDGAVNISRWAPRTQGVQGYLMMEPRDPFALRAWDLSRLEEPLAKAGARLVIVLADAPGLVGTLGDRLGMSIVRHLPPAPRMVFTAHLANGCSGEEKLSQCLGALEAGLLDELLPDGLPPRHAARAAAAVLRRGIAGRPVGSQVLGELARSEGHEVVYRAQSDPILLAHLLSVCVYGGLPRSVVTEGAEALLRLARPLGKDMPVALSPRVPSTRDVRKRPLLDTLRRIGAHCVPCVRDDEAMDTVSFLWPSMGEAVWEAVCRDHADVLPLLHSWLAVPDQETEQIERAGRAVAAIAMATGGRSMELLPRLASAPSLLAPQVAAWCLATVADGTPAARTGADLLEQWSVSTQAPLRHAVAYACHVTRGGLTEERALLLLQRLVETLSDDVDDLSIAMIEAALVQRFTLGDSRARAIVLDRMRDWAESDGVLGLLAAIAFPSMAGTDLRWWSEGILADVELTSCAVQLAGHALNESFTFPPMRDALLAWCDAVTGADHNTRALRRVFDGLVDARQPGTLRLLLAIDREPDAVPGKELAAGALADWRSQTTPTSNSE
ncbi:hypothetical protein [Streptomyces sp. NBC_00083]|uniref:hypothetical protein n=1 Tax=Streptomyces sp. NBC_00083 TaxID=2975647 RepID=UPI0022571262|nr:hypothetical protein [Streptomyces sp. NBC_00083]MCX5386266.1 hypothetical protein [Streptomyces sp. NBC_00083]